MCGYIFYWTRLRKIVVVKKIKRWRLLWIISLKKNNTLNENLIHENLIKLLKYESTVNSNMNIHNNRLISGNIRSKIKN